MKVKKLIDEYLILPFPEVQPDFWLKIELWKCQNEYLPIIYVRDVFKLPQTLVCSKRQHRKKYHIWVEDQWGIFPENCTIRDMPEDEVINTVLEIIKCSMSKKDISPSARKLLNYHNENIQNQQHRH